MEHKKVGIVGANSMVLASILSMCASSGISSQIFDDIAKAPKSRYYSQNPRHQGEREKARRLRQLNKQK